MIDELEERRLAERDRRRQVMIVVVMAVMLFGTIAFYYGVLQATYSPSGGGRTMEAVGRMEFPVAKADWPRFFAAADRFATERGFYSRDREYGLPITDKTDWIHLMYWREGGPWLNLSKPIGREAFQISFTDVGGTGAWREIQAEFVTRVVKAGGFAQ